MKPSKFNYQFFSLSISSLGAVIVVVFFFLFLQLIIARALPFKVMGCSLWCSTAHALGRFSMDFDLMPLVLSSIFFLNQKQRLVSMDLKRPSYQRTVRWTMQGLTEPFLNIVGCCNFTKATSHKVCTILLDKGLFLKNRLTLAKKKRSVRPSSRLKTVDLDCRLSLSVARLILVQKFTKFDCSRQKVPKR